MSDYERIASAIEFITRHVTRQPMLEEIAAHLHLSPFHFQRMFCRWAGVTPKRYLQVLTLERAKQLLAESKSMLEVACELGLSSGSRLYDHFVHLEAVTPGEYREQGRGLKITYGVHDTPFGKAYIATTPKGICRFAFLEETGKASQLEILRKDWPLATLSENHESTRAIIQAVFDRPLESGRPLPISLHVSGTNFQVNVWKALLQIEPATVSSYASIAAAIGHPAAARAVGLAAGANPVAFLIPCHRVIQQSGNLGGYRWGITRKHAIHAWESARQEAMQVRHEDAAQVD